MHCTKCRFNSFDHALTCPRCGNDWGKQRETLNLGWITSATFDWIGEENSVGAGAATASASASQGAGESEYQETGIEELSFDDFEEVNLGQVSSEATNSSHDSFEDIDLSLEGDVGESMPEISLVEDDDDMESTILGKEDAGLDIDLEDLQAQGTSSDLDDEEISLDDLDLELDDLIETSKKGE
ncbi:MAG: hypothetical protein ACOC24_00050 [Desulfovibrionales bacterium]